jgi:hypothetical protein
MSELRPDHRSSKSITRVGNPASDVKCPADLGLHVDVDIGLGDGLERFGGHAWTIHA